MNIAKKYLPVFYKSLVATDLGLADARIRDEFHKELTEATKTFEEAEQVIYRTLCLKDEKGQPEMTELGQYQFQGENIEKVQEERKILLEEEVELNPKNPDKIKEFLNNTQYKPKTGEAEMVDFIISKL